MRFSDGRELMPRLIDLLIAVDECHQLAAACTRVALSYRYAWGLLKEAEAAFGAPLLASVRGRGARLSPLGEKLVWAERRVAARLTPILDSLASELEVEVERALSETRPILRVQATHGFAVETMRRFLVEQEVPLDLKYRSTGEVLSALHGGGCDLAGLHFAEGELQQRVIARYHLQALGEAESEAYIRHRLGVAGFSGTLPFDAAALRRIHALARGVPRRITLPTALR